MPSAAYYRPSGAYTWAMTFASQLSAPESIPLAISVTTTPGTGGADGTAVAEWTVNQSVIQGGDAIVFLFLSFGEGETDVAANQPTCSRSGAYTITVTAGGDPVLEMTYEFQMTAPPNPDQYGTDSACTTVTISQ